MGSVINTYYANVLQKIPLGILRPLSREKKEKVEQKKKSVTLH